MKTPSRPPYESADRWNQRHPPGTPVRLMLADGTAVDDVTASHAQQWGSLAIITLQRRAGMWTTTALIAADDGETAPPSPRPATLASRRRDCGEPAQR